VSWTVLLVSDPHTNFYYPTTIGYWVTRTEYLFTFPLSETVTALCTPENDKLCRIFVQEKQKVTQLEKQVGDLQQQLDSCQQNRSSDLPQLQADLNQAVAERQAEFMHTYL